MGRTACSAFGQHTRGQRLLAVLAAMAHAKSCRAGRHECWCAACWAQRCCPPGQSSQRCMSQSLPQSETCPGPHLSSLDRATSHACVGPPRPPTPCRRGCLPPEQLHPHWVHGHAGLHRWHQLAAAHRHLFFRLWRHVSVPPVGWRCFAVLWQQPHTCWLLGIDGCTMLQLLLAGHQVPPRLCRCRCMKFRGTGDSADMWGRTAAC